MIYVETYNFLSCNISKYLSSNISSVRISPAYIFHPWRKAAPLHEYSSENEVDDECCQNLARCLSTSLPGDQFWRQKQQHAKKRERIRKKTEKKTDTSVWVKPCMPICNPKCLHDHNRRKGKERKNQTAERWSKHCQRHYGPRHWLLWPVILVE